MAQFIMPHIIEEGYNSLQYIGRLAANRGITRTLVILDKNLVKTSTSIDRHIDERFAEAAIDVFFIQFTGEPKVDDVQAIQAYARLHNVDGVVAVGGGTVIDLAKAVSTFLPNPGLEWKEIAGLPHLRRLPLIAVPSTAGTGSEVTKVMVITDAHSEIKMNPAHPDLVPDIAILDPTLTLTLPSSFTAFTGIDALTHAIEAYVSRQAQPLSDAFALNAIRRISKALPQAVAHGENRVARREMLLASLEAGLAFSNASTNLAHAMGRPLGAHFHIPHGLSVGILLPLVMKWSLPDAAERYTAIGLALLPDQSLGESSALTAVSRFLDEFGLWVAARKSIEPQRLNEMIPRLVQDALSGNGIVTNPRIPTARDVTVLYEELVSKLETITITS